MPSNKTLWVYRDGEWVEIATRSYVDSTTTTAIATGKPYAYYMYWEESLNIGDNGPIDWTDADKVYDPGSWIAEPGTYGGSTVGVGGIYFAPPFGEYKVTLNARWNGSSVGNRSSDNTALLCIEVAGRVIGMLKANIDWATEADPGISISGLIIVDNDLFWGQTFYTNFFALAATSISPTFINGTSILIEQLRAY
jgi:hypothetical protein